jgi:scyllo-inositol 2-dehydrogenase (NADP+)
MSTIRTLNIGFLGLGRALGYHLPPIAQSGGKFRIAGVFDVSEQRRAEIAEQLQATAYASYEEMLAEATIDLIVVATPPTFHAAHSIQALESGKHVIVEKPMALNAADADRMVDAAEQAGRRLVVNHNHRYSGVMHYPTIKDALDRGLIGRPYQYDVQLLSGWGGYQGSPDYVPNWECKKEHGGGTLFSWGPHLVDLVLHAHPSKPKSVFCVLNTHGWEFDGDSNAALTVIFEDGATAQIEISYVSPHEFTVFYVRGENGSIKYEADGNRLSLRSGNFGDFREEELPTEQLPGDIIHANLYHAIEHGEPPVIAPHDIHVVIATLEAARVSAEEGRVVDLGAVLAGSTKAPGAGTA